MVHFLHLADCHLGGWREEKMRNLPTKAFSYVVDYALQVKPDFLVLAGDLFNTSLPPLDILKDATVLLKKLKDHGIPVYCIAGSHDYSPTGKTMLDVLEEAGLCINVMKGKVVGQTLSLSWTKDPKTGVLLTGILGKRGMLDKRYYEVLDRETLERQEGFKIFLFHTSLSELKPKELSEMDAMPITLFPKHCSYYAGGHVHILGSWQHPDYPFVFYPGPTFPNSFSELEKLGGGGFLEYKDGAVVRHRILLKPVQAFVLDCTHKTPLAINAQLAQIAASAQVADAIVLLRLTGTLTEGSLQDLALEKFSSTLLQNGAYVLLRNTAGLLTKPMEEIMSSSLDKDALEARLLQDHLVGTVSGFSSQEQLRVAQ
ncbi:MAG: exonuclease SbcCD subunit D, partial [Candidatus Woesearchaeota archaeon]